MKSIDLPLWPHQKQALRFSYTRSGSLLWLPMGSGKSRIVVDYCNNDRRGPVLIFAPLKVCAVWKSEFEKYAVTDYKMLILDKGSVSDRADLLLDNLTENNLIAVVNYDICFMEPMAKALKSISWDIIILDECHRIKSHNGKQSLFIANLAQDRRKIIGLSGTPLSTGQVARGGKKIGAWLDIFGQARAINPNIFGVKWFPFIYTYGQWMKEPFPKLLDDLNVDMFNRKLSQFVFHVPEEKMAYSLPDYTEQNIIVELSAKAYMIYQDMEDEMVAELDDDVFTASNALVKMLRLQQISGGFIKQSDLITEDGIKITGKTEQVHTDKLDALQDLLFDIPADDKIVVFAQFTAEINAIASLNTHRKVFFVRGGENTSDEWKQSTGGLLIVQIQAGSEGIDLTDARYCVYYSLCHSMKDYQQSRKRIHRPGQTRPVTYYHIIAKGTVDDLLYKAQATKQDAVNIVRDNLLQKMRGTL